ncbi:putative aldouronate transport system permease protein [Paenibacillus sophorae]|uniref:Carbohydrate ABC transporter permease n=1 Tax=Paenibacillus sophorae TaxID=1333845 RepID=A0A1H8LKQ5_9BACL|nr:carbohydrate ABC transporter permease [Paenibacillus sophorae]QWU17260.1 carbohydrate ABC transporter permease [Paenibacillus sophorae]SEO05386.1 putative aldouronate transport system permease protein [Paenibacillus sophorae]
MFRVKRKLKSDIAFDVVNFIVLGGFTLMILYPLYFIVIASISDPNQIYAGNVWLWPKSITFDGYRRIFSDNTIWIGYRNSLFYAALAAVISSVLTVMAAYPLSRKDLYGRNVFMMIFVVTLFFNGGIIPTYLLVKDLHMINTIWAVVLPGAVDAFAIIIARTFFQSLPDELREAAAIDGCTNLRYIWSVVVPLSKPIIAVLVLLAVVRQWNGFFDALIYVNDSHLYPLQLILRNILIQNQPSGDMLTDITTLVAQQKVTELIKFGVIIVAALPLLTLYPLLQRYFVKGVMIGSVKG